MSRLKTFWDNNKNEFVSHSCFFVCFLVLQRAVLLGMMSPFAIAFAFALLLLQKNGIVVGVEYFLSSILFDFSFSGLIQGASAFFCIVLLFLVAKITKKKIKLCVALFFLFLSQTAFLYFNIYCLEKIVVSAVSIVVSLCFVYIFNLALSSVFEKGIQSRFTNDELICLSAFAIAIFCGLSSIFVFGVDISVAIVAFIVLFVSKSFSKTVTLCVASLAGIGFAFYSASLVFEAVFVSFAIVSCLLSENNRFFAVFAILLIDALFGCFFNAYVVYNIFSVLPLLIFCMVFVCIPSKVYAKIKNFSFAYEGNLLSEYLILSEREELRSKLLQSGMLFSQMQNEYRNICLGTLDKLGASEMLCDELVQRVCEGCKNNNCCRENAKMRQAILKLFELGIEKQKVSILDANNLIAENCCALSSVIAEVNSGLKNYFEYEKAIKTNDQGKLMISEQMGATANMFKEIAQSAGEIQKVDKKRSGDVLQALLSRGVVVNECVVISGESGVKKVYAVLRNKDVLSPEILKGLKSVFKIEFSAKEHKMSKYSGWSIASFAPSEKYKLAVGFASTAKEDGGVSGDNHSIIKIDDNRYLFAISDGMGHGEKANKISTSTLGLVENFYKSGFSSRTIVSSINKILLPKDDEVFVTLDACVVDLSVGVADFVKMGASVSVVKSQNQCKLVQASSLPLGVAGGIAPNVQTVVLKDRDLVVIASDGIVDSFDNVQDFACFVNNSTTTNTQMLADDILEEAQSRTRHPDDMTVIVLKINANGFSA